jgi:hypothetical protein
MNRLSRQQRDASVAAWQADLAERFERRRCRCGAPAVAVQIGSDAVRAPGNILIHRVRPDRNFCMNHLPWISQAESAA